MAVYVALSTPVMNGSLSGDVSQTSVDQSSFINFMITRMTNMIWHHNSIVVAVVHVGIHWFYLNTSSSFPNYVFWCLHTLALLYSLIPSTPFFLKAELPSLSCFIPFNANRAFLSTSISWFLDSWHLFHDNTEASLVLVIPTCAFIMFFAYCMRVRRLGTGWLALMRWQSW